MNRNKFVKGLSLFLVLATMLCMLTVVSLADAGSFSGDSDYGGWDSGSDYSSSDWSSSDWSSSSSDSSYSSSGDGDIGGVGCGVGLVVVIIVIIVSSLNGKNKKGGGGSSGGGTPAGAVSTNKSTIDPTELKKKDPNFSTQEFLEKVANAYVQMQNCWQDKKWEPMRALMTDALDSQFERQLDALKRNGQTNYVERISVLGSRIVGYYQDEVNDNLVVELRTRIVDYTVKDATGEVISGSKTAEKFLTYEWTLIRSKDSVTPDKEALKEIHCPNCGAAVHINHSGQCEYCGQVITVNEYDWVISAIRGISQQTRG